MASAAPETAAAVKMLQRSDGGRVVPIAIECPACGWSYRLTDRLAGQRVRCKKCGGRIDVPNPSPPVEYQGTLTAANRGDAHPRPLARPAPMRPIQSPLSPPRPLSRLPARNNKANQVPLLLIGLAGIAGFTGVVVVVALAFVALRMWRTEVPLVSVSAPGDVNQTPVVLTPAVVPELPAPMTSSVHTPPSTSLQPSPVQPRFARSSQMESAEALLRQYVAGLNDMTDALAKATDSASMEVQVPIAMAAFKRAMECDEKLSKIELTTEEREGVAQ